MIAASKSISRNQWPNYGISTCCSREKTRARDLQLHRCPALQVLSQNLLVFLETETGLNIVHVITKIVRSAEKRVVVSRQIAIEAKDFVIVANEVEVEAEIDADPLTEDTIAVDPEAQKEDARTLSVEIKGNNTTDTRCESNNKKYFLKHMGSFKKVISGTSPHRDFYAESVVACFIVDCHTLEAGACSCSTKATIVNN